MAHAALRLSHDLLPALRNVTAAYPEYAAVHVVGHSLGGGTAALLAFLLKPGAYTMIRLHARFQNFLTLEPVPSFFELLKFNLRSGLRFSL
jgi:hypothetical protein